MRNVGLIVLVAVSIAFGIARFIVPVSGAVNPADVFKDAAHIWVGVLIGVAIVRGRRWWLLPIALTVLEVAAFFIRRN